MNLNLIFLFLDVVVVRELHSIDRHTTILILFVEGRGGCYVYFMYIFILTGGWLSVHRINVVCT